MTLLYTHPRFLDHQTGAHPECPERLRRITALLAQRGLDQMCVRPEWDPVSDDQLALVHDLGYVAMLRDYTAKGGGRIEIDTTVSSASYEVSRLGVGAACAAVDAVMTGSDNRALCLVRPPGHHALRNAPMGFCLFNSIAVAARYAATHFKLDRVLIVDWDVHHGNGTQDAFWEDAQVGFFSIHRWPFYPGTGDRDEIGSGAGRGTTHNIPVSFGTPRGTYLNMFTVELEEFASRIRPQLMLISAGFDSHRADPVGSLGLEVEDFSQLTEIVRQVADSYCQGRLVSLLEGGYNLNVLGDCVAAHLEGLL